IHHLQRQFQEHAVS
nr:immunoglobulin heavy chain junction region [Homo sapiens]